MEFIQYLFKLISKMIEISIWTREDKFHISKRPCIMHGSIPTVTIPPPAHPRGFAIFSSLGVLFPTPGHKERGNFPPLGLLRRNFRPIIPYAPRLFPPPAPGTRLLAKFPTPGSQGRTLIWGLPGRGGGGDGNCRNWIMHYSVYYINWGEINRNAFMNYSLKCAILWNGRGVKMLKTEKSNLRRGRVGRRSGPLRPLP